MSIAPLLDRMFGDKDRTHQPRTLNVRCLHGTSLPEHGEGERRDIRRTTFFANLTHGRRGAMHTTQRRAQFQPTGLICYTTSTFRDRGSLHSAAFRLHRAAYIGGNAKDALGRGEVNWHRGALRVAQRPGTVRHHRQHATNRPLSTRNNARPPFPRLLTCCSVARELRRGKVLFEFSKYSLQNYLEK